MNIDAINFNRNSTLYKTFTTEKNNDFQKLLKSDDYDAILEKTLDSLSDLEKEAHLKTLKELEEDGYSKEQLNTINMYVLIKKENLLGDFKLSDEDKKLVDTYDDLFNKIFDAIKEKREEKLKLKPLQTEQMMTDTLLKTVDNTEQNISNDNKLSIEI